MFLNLPTWEWISKQKISRIYKLGKDHRRERRKSIHLIMGFIEIRNPVSCNAGSSITSYYELH